MKVETNFVYVGKAWVGWVLLTVESHPLLTTIHCLASGIKESGRIKIYLEKKLNFSFLHSEKKKITTLERKSFKILRILKLKK